MDSIKASIKHRERIASDIVAVGSFIGWHDEKYMHGGFTSKQAFEAFCRLINKDPATMRKIILGES